MQLEKQEKIGILGLGLIGGSILKSLAKFDFELFVVSKSEETVEKAKKYAQNASTSIEILKDCDIVFVCTPMNKTLEALDLLDEILSENTIVTDVCSLKRFLFEKKYKFNFIPSHPMAGTEFSGFDNSFDGLFDGCKWVLTPLQNDKENLEKLLNIIYKLDSIPIITSPEKHDEAVALVSHMPMVLSQALFKAAQSDEFSLSLASSGFRDMTRLAQTNIEMADDMVNLNSDNIQAAILKLYAAIGELLNNDYKLQISEIKKRRQDMFIDGKNIL